MYAICNIICGCEIPAIVREFVNEYTGDYKDAGFETFYSGSGDTPAFSGIVISKFDECSNLRAVELIARMNATAEQIAKARQNLTKTKNLFQDYLGECEGVGDEEKQKLLDSIPQEPEVLLIWSTS